MLERLAVQFLFRRLRHARREVLVARLAARGERRVFPAQPAPHEQVGWWRTRSGRPRHRDVARQPAAPAQHPGHHRTDVGLGRDAGRTDAPARQGERLGQEVVVAGGRKNYAPAPTCRLAGPGAASPRRSAPPARSWRASQGCRAPRAAPPASGRTSRGASHHPPSTTRSPTAPPHPTATPTHARKAPVPRPRPGNRRATGLDDSEMLSRGGGARQARGIVTHGALVPSATAATNGYLTRSERASPPKGDLPPGSFCRLCGPCRPGNVGRPVRLP